MLTKAAIQRLRSLREKKQREELGLFVVEGDKVIRELLAARHPLLELYATDDWPEPPEASGMEVRRIRREDMARVSHFPAPSPVLAVGRIERRPLAAADLARGLTLALDGLQDAGNVGTLLRVADWFGCELVLLSPDCADIFNQKVINASMGSFARVMTHSVDLVATLAGLPVAILGCDLGGDDVHALPPVRDAVIVVGSEGRGLSPAVAALVTRRITIPRHGQAESLNAAIAAAVVLDNLRRAQKAKGKGHGA